MRKHKRYHIKYYPADTILYLQSKNVARRNCYRFEHATYETVKIRGKSAMTPRMYQVAVCRIRNNAGRRQQVPPVTLSTTPRVNRVMVIAITRVSHSGGDAPPTSSSSAHRKKSNLRATPPVTGCSSAGLTKQQQQQEHSARMSMTQQEHAATLGSAGSGLTYAGTREYVAHPPPRRLPASSLSAYQQSRLRRLHEQCSAARQGTRGGKATSTSVPGLQRSAVEPESSAQWHGATYKVDIRMSVALVVRHYWPIKQTKGIVLAVEPPWLSFYH